MLKEDVRNHQKSTLLSHNFAKNQPSYYLSLKKKKKENVNQFAFSKHQISMFKK